MSLAQDHLTSRLGRRFTLAGTSPYDGVHWQSRDARLVDHRDGSVAFEQLGVEFPEDWSVTASNIVAQKYFRGSAVAGTRETSLRQVIDRVAGTIRAWGERDGYFDDADEADTFADELRHLLLHQYVSFNSPVWFNIGVPGVPQQASACFILDVEDDLRSILNWYTEEGIIFQGGSGAGANLSKLRSSKEHLSGGGRPSGPVSFMRGADASAGTIKSGGTTRRAAKMVILDADHPDISEFIWCKAREERKARVLRDAGFDMDLDGLDAASLQYQNANNSVRVSDELMQAVLADEQWELTARTTGEVIERVPARTILREIAEASWECADPGVQFDTTINRWNTTPSAGRITASNPCFTGDTLVHTDRGLVAFTELVDRVNHGEAFSVYTHDATHPDEPSETVALTSPDAIMITGDHPVLRLRFANGMEVRCTSNHRFFTENRGFVRADELEDDDRVRVLDQPAPPVRASLTIPVHSESGHWRELGDRHAALALPEEWDASFAHWLGWLVGDGCISGNTVTTIYGTAEERDTILPLHQMLIEDIGGRAYKTTSQPNGTTELRISRAPFRRYLEALGVKVAKAPQKTIPWAVQQAPREIVASFLRGLFDADGCVIHNPSKGSYVGLGSASAELLRGAQRLLSTFGIVSRIYRIRKGGSSSGFEYTTVAGEHRRYESRSDGYDLRIAGAGIAAFAHDIGFSVPHKVDTLATIMSSWTKGPYATKAWTTLAERSDDGIETTYNLSEPRNHSYVVNGLVVSNCSEHLRLDNSACNLASLNLLRFLEEDGRFDVEAFEHAVQVVTTAQDILVGASDYPTEKIAEMTAASRDIGLGYTNLGACLMALGFPYDSDEGRAWAAAVTGILTGSAARRSTILAERLAPAPLFAADADAWAGVYDLHLDAAQQVPPVAGQPELNERLVALWQHAAQEVRRVGARNAELTVAAPTGTISFMMGADTTGIEPDLGLVKFKKLVGGGTLEIVNQTVPRALRRLGYDDEQVSDIVEHIAEHHSVLGAPHLDPDHVAVFACAIGDNVISYGGHLRMMAAIQPFFSGAMSKTVNVPEHTTVDEVEQLLIDAWRSGIKCVALYRDNCKVAQPLSTGSSSTGAASSVPVTPSELLDVVVEQAARPTRERMPRSRSSRTFEFRVADCKGFVTVGEYADGRPGELFIRVSKQGSTMAGIMDAFAISVSHGLQYGVPLRAFVHAFVGMRFEPAGITDDPEVRIANSLIDYLFRRLALEYLPYEERLELGILGTSERLQPTLPGVEEQATPTGQGLDLAPHPSPEAAVPAQLEAPAPEEPAMGTAADAPMCMQCGIQMTRAGSCYVCGECGTTSGCS
jgi:ribonucleoside-diphosphate reductase alpha chain